MSKAEVKKDVEKEEKKDKKRKYDLNDKTIHERIFFDCLHGKIIKNEKGHYIDIRKYFNRHPSTKGVRLRIDDFEEVAGYLLPLIKELKGTK